MIKTLKYTFFASILLAKNYALAQYEIYPRPQKISYEDKSFKISSSVNVVLEKGVDKYTKKRLITLLTDKGIAHTISSRVVADRTNVLVGTNKSGGLVDKYFDQKVNHKETFFDKNDSHIVSVQDNIIAVLGDDTDSAFYGVTTLKHVFNQVKERQITEFRVDDYSDVKHRGFIEGYYGNPWSNEDRAELMKFGGDYKLNTYFFAPKDDIYHNKKWRELYPEKELAEIKKLAQVGNETKNKYVYALHPFMHNAIRFDNEKNYQHDLDIIKAKFTQLLVNDVRAFSILADDARVPAQGAEAYVKLLVDLTNWLHVQKKHYPDLVTDLPYCPNGYSGNGSSEQLKIVNRAPRSVSIIMTGGGIWGEVSKDFTTKFKGNISSENHPGRPPYLWINWPCTDNSRQHLIMGGNDTFLHPGVSPANISGIILNPMQQAEANKSALFAIADYAWNIWDDKNQADQNWHDSFKYMDHGTSEENKASTALREISKHMINQNMDGRVRKLEESVKLAPRIKAFRAKLNQGTLTKQDTLALITEFKKLRTAAKYYQDNPGNKRTQSQITPWLNCWEDSTTAAIHYLECINAVLDNDKNYIWHHYSIGRTAFERSKSYAFWYVNHFEYAEVGVQHIVPLIKMMEKYLGSIVTKIISPNSGENLPIYKLAASSSDDLSIRGQQGLKQMVDGDHASGPHFARNPYQGESRDSIPVNAYVKVDLPQKGSLGRIVVVQGKRDKLHKAALEYTLDGSIWKTLKTFTRGEPTLICDVSGSGIKAKSVRVRNLEKTRRWWSVKEFKVSPSDREAILAAITNTAYNLSVEATLEQAKLQPIKGVTIEPNQYLGVKLERIKDLKSIQIKKSNDQLTLQASVNAVKWETIVNNNLPDARYIRLINLTKNKITVDIDKFEVNSNEIIPLRLIKTHAPTYKNAKAELAFDGDFISTTIFTDGLKSGQEIVYDLGQVIDVDNLKYVVLDTESDHIRDAKFQLSLDGENWKDAFTTKRSNGNTNSKPQDNGYKHGSLSNGIVPISHSYLEGKNLNIKARYFRILATDTYTKKWVRISEILINDGVYRKTSNNPTYVSTPIELAGHAPENMFDGDLTSSYRPDTKGKKIKKGSIIYRVSEKTKIKQINIVQNGNEISNAKVLVRTGRNQWHQLGILSKSLNEIINHKYKHIYEIKIEWQGVPPTIYEIILAAEN